MQSVRRTVAWGGVWVWISAACASPDLSSTGLLEDDLAKNPDTGEVFDPRTELGGSRCTANCGFDGVCCSSGCSSPDLDCTSQTDLQALCEIPLLGPLFASELYASLVTVFSDRWPNAGAVWDEIDPYDTGADFYWAHMKKSVDGFGPTMALVQDRPLCGGDGCWDLLTEDVTSDGNPYHPTLLFFDRTGDTGSWRSWPLIGIGWHFPFSPCKRPTLTCQTNSDLFFIHEAGYHHDLLGGDGGMTLAETSDLCTRSLLSGGLLQSGCGDSSYDATSVDAAGCQDIDDEDVETHVNRIKHGRVWDFHLWFPPPGSSATFAIEDPWRRWSDAPANGRVAIAGRAFFEQNQSACNCH